MRRSGENNVGTSDYRQETMETNYEPMEQDANPMPIDTLELMLTNQIDARLVNDSYNGTIGPPYQDTNVAVLTNDPGPSAVVPNGGIATVAGESLACLDSTIDPDTSEMSAAESLDNLCEPSRAKKPRLDDSAQAQQVPNGGPSQNVQVESTDTWDTFAQSASRKYETNITSEVPAPGTLVCPKTEKRAGPYILGPLIGTSPVRSIVQCLARKARTEKYYTIKILTLNDENEHETQDDRQGKMLLHAEYSLLSLLQNQDGVVHHHGFFKVFQFRSYCAKENTKPVNFLTFIMLDSLAQRWP